MGNNELLMAMMNFDKADPWRIQHFTKVYTYAKMIGEMEKIPADKQFILETAAIVHDIGIKLSLQKYGDSIGPHQEAEGAPAARELLTSLGYPEEVVERVSYLVGHHHTYTCIDDIDYQILVEADFLVNIFEGYKDNSAVQNILDRIFKTETGKEMARRMFTPEEPMVFKRKKID